MSKEYTYQGETFAVSKPNNCTMTVSAKGLTAKLSIHPVTKQYFVELGGFRMRKDSLQAALDIACKQLLADSTRPSAKELCADMDGFYEALT